MNQKSQNTIFQDNNAPQHLSRRIYSNSNSSNGIINRLKSLCCGCFAIVPKESETYINYNPDEYDYVVEKLFVKRVPFGFFAIPQDLLHRPKNGEEQEKDVNTSTSSSGPKPTMKSMYSVMSDISQLHQFKSENQKVALIERHGNKLHFNKDKDICNKNAVHISLTDQHLYKNQKLKEIDKVNVFSELHSPLKESDNLSKQYLPLNFQRSKTAITQDVAETASTSHTNTNHRSYVSDHNIKPYYVSIPDKFQGLFVNQTKEEALRSEGVTKSPTPPNNLSSSKSNASKLSTDEKIQNENTNISQSNIVPDEKPIVTVPPDQIQDMTKNVNDLIKTRNSMKQWSNETANLVEQTDDTKPASLAIMPNKNKTVKAILRWKIIIKHRESETLDSSKENENQNLEPANTN